MTISNEDFYLHLLDASNTNIFQWFVIIVTLSLGLLTILKELDESKKNDITNHNTAYTLIYLFLSFIITFSIYQIIHILYLQNQWINQLNSTIQNIFYKSRSDILNAILGYKYEDPDLIRCLCFGIAYLVIFIILIWILKIFEKDWFNKKFRHYLKIPRLRGVRYRRLFQIGFLIFSGWFGEFSYLISFFRVIEDTIKTGYLRSSLYFQYNGLYGLSWRMHFVIRSPLEFIAGIPILLIIVWIFYEFYKGEIGLCVPR